MFFHGFFFTLENITSVFNHVYLQQGCRDEGQENEILGLYEPLTSKYALSDKYL